MNTLLLALETATIARLTRLHKSHMRLTAELTSAQIQASLLGSQAAAEQLPGNEPGTHVPKPITLPRVLELAMLSTIARTAIMNAYRQSAISTYAANDADGWIWEADANPCLYCESMDGTIHPIEEEFESHPNCRCTSEPYFT